MHFACNLDLSIHPLALCCLVCKRSDEFSNFECQSSLRGHGLQRAQVRRGIRLFRLLWSQRYQAYQVSAPGHWKQQLGIDLAQESFLFRTGVRKPLFRAVAVHGGRLIGSQQILDGRRLLRKSDRAPEIHAKRLLKTEHVAATQQDGNLRNVQNLRDAPKNNVEKYTSIG